MNLEAIKKELESKTNYRFNLYKNILGDECLSLKALPQKSKIEIIKRANPQTQFIIVSGTDTRTGYCGFGSPCDDIEEIIEVLNAEAEEYGYIAPKAEQLSF